MPNLGDIGLTKVDGWGGRVIQIAEILDGSSLAASRWQHAFVYVGNGNKVEAEPEGARLRPVDTSRETLWLPCPARYGQFVAAHAVGFLGTPYSWLDYAAIGALRLHLPVTNSLHEFVQDTGHMMCSQLAAEAAFRGGWWLGRDPQNTTPAELAQIALEAQRAHRY